MDKLKDQLCEKHGIVLVRIPYWIKSKKLEDFIINEMSRLGVLGNFGKTKEETND